MGTPAYLADASLKDSFALPNGAAATQSDGIELPQGANGHFVAGHECLIEAPAMATGVMGDGKTMIYSVETDSDPEFGSPTVIIPEIMRQTGAGGAGCAAKSQRFRLPANVERYVRVKATGSTTGNASSASATFTIFAAG